MALAASSGTCVPNFLIDSWQVGSTSKGGPGHRATKTMGYLEPVMKRGDEGPPETEDGGWRPPCVEMLTFGTHAFSSEACQSL